MTDSGLLFFFEELHRVVTLLIFMKLFLGKVDTK